MVQQQISSFEVHLHLAEMNVLLMILEADKKKDFIFVPCAVKDLLLSLPASLMTLKVIRQLFKALPTGKIAETV